MNTVGLVFLSVRTTALMPAVESFLGSSAAMQEVFRLIERVGPPKPAFS